MFASCPLPPPAPSELLFFTLKESGEVGFISLRGAQSPYLTLAGRSKQPNAVTYDPIKQVRNFHHHHHHQISQLGDCVDVISSAPFTVSCPLQLYTS